MPTARMELLRFATAGSVDDGKSTLIGRLLLETKQIFEDQLEAVERTSRDRGFDYTNLALLTDGLRAEREQGITIDVAYRYFATPRRKFIIADTPGHVQYTRNMVTGASTADLALVLIDARKGVLEQSRRHSVIASLLQVKHLVLCVNKMDLVDYEQERFDEICDEFMGFASKLDIDDLTFIPISALHGDNVTAHSPNTPWYEGATLLHHLEHVYIGSDRNLIDVRFPVQYVIRPMSHEYHDYRGYGGQVASGMLRPGDEVVVLPSGFTTTIASIDEYGGPVDEAVPPMSVSVRLVDDVDVSRGAMISRPNNMPVVTQDIDAMVCWFNEQPLRPGANYAIKHTTRTTKSRVQSLQYRLDVNTLASRRERDVARDQRSRTSHPPHRGAALRRRVPAQPRHRELHPDRRGHLRDRRCGDDPRHLDHGSLAARRGARLASACSRRRFAPMSSSSPDVVWHDSGVSRAERWRTRDVHGATVWFTGLSGSGKSTVASAVAVELTARGVLTYTLDGDNLRHGLNGDLGFSAEARTENVRRVAEVARLFADAGVVALGAAHQPVSRRTRAGACAPRSGGTRPSSRCSSTPRSTSAKPVTRRACTPRRARASSPGSPGSTTPTSHPRSPISCWRRRRSHPRRVRRQCSSCWWLRASRRDPHPARARRHPHLRSGPIGGGGRGRARHRRRGEAGVERGAVRSAARGPRRDRRRDLRRQPLSRRPERRRSPTRWRSTTSWIPPRCCSARGRSICAGSRSPRPSTPVTRSCSRGRRSRCIRSWRNRRAPSRTVFRCTSSVTTCRRWRTR